MDELKFQSGAQIDTRSPAEKLKDFLLGEIVASINLVIWTEKVPAFWRKFPIFNQDGSGSCVAQTIAKMMGVLYWLTNGTYVHFSATHIYQRRINRPQGGMQAVDAFDIASRGVTLEELVPSQNITDTQMDGVVIPEYKQKVGEIFRSPNYVALPIKDIDAIASVIQTTNKAVMVWFYFTYPEWTDVPFVIDQSLDLYAPATARHSVTAVDFTLYQGKKALIIEDSWGTSFGKAGQRIITEDFFKARNWYAGYLINFVFQEGVITKPQYNSMKTLKFGETSIEVKALQDVLRYEGLFPINVSSTGLYGSLTAKGVLAFQKKYKVAPVAELDLLAGKVVGPKTVIKLNELY